MSSDQEKDTGEQEKNTSPDTQEQTTEQQPDNTRDNVLGEAGIKALVEERNAKKEAEKRVKELESQIAELKAAQDEQKATFEKEVADREKTAKDAELQVMRIRSIVQAGLPVDSVDLVTGVDQDSINEQVGKLVDLRGAGQQKKTTTPNHMLGVTQDTPTGPEAAFLALLDQQLG